MLRAQSGAGNCLRFDGTNGYVSIPHTNAFNAYPFAATAWIRTTSINPTAQGIVSKYPDAQFDGWSVHLVNGRVNVWYIRSFGNWVLASGDNPIDAGFVADGSWHHIAFAVDATGGRVFVDGTLRATAIWTGPAGPVTTTLPLQIGRYYTYANRFQGDIDEVSVWNQALGANTVNYLKHRRLTGNEDGLAGLWHLDEGMGTITSNAVVGAVGGTLSNSPAWTGSAAPIALAMVATNCLRFDGTNGYVQVPHNTNLNAYPLTAMGWFRTTNTVSFVQGIVSKYAESSLNGWSLFVQNGKLRGFFYRPGFGAAIDATSVATVADGGWHHAALTVDAAGGKLWLDGSVVGTGSWVSPGPPTNTQPVLLGCYSPANYSQRFHGALDEITVWNRALTTNEIQTLKNRPLVGNETNLVAYWRLDEGTGTVVGDATGHGYNGSFSNSPSWTGSTAYLGDGSVYLLAATDIPFIERYYAVNGADLVNSFGVTAKATFWRFYDFGTAPSNLLVAYKLDTGLQIAPAGTPLAIKPNTYSNAFNFASYNASAPIVSGVAAGMATINQFRNVEPDTGVQLDSVNNFHLMTGTLSHDATGGGFTTDGTEASDPARLLHFNGHVFFGGIDTILTNVINTPAAGTVTAPTHLASQLQIGAGGAYLAIAPGFKFGGGAAFNVNLGANGFATNLNGSFSLANPTQFFETNGIRYRLPGATLSAAGMVATNLEAWFPAGFGLATSTNTRAMMPFASKTNVALGPDLLPTSSPVIFTAASYNTNLLWFAEETKPFLIGGSQILWRIPEGEFYMPDAQVLQFVRQQEDADLDAERPNLVDQLGGYRISNDSYYRNIAAVSGAPVYVRPDTNGGALLTIQAALAPGNYRPHFPYVPGFSHIPAAPGELVITNDLIDTAASYLLLQDVVALRYARDCPPDGGCSNAAVVGDQVLFFTAPPGHFGLGELRFTPEGGLLAYGTIAPQNLTWGFAGAGKYAQRTSDMSDGACYFSGTFLKADDLAGEQDARRPTRLLHTGYGSANTNDFTYVERPGAANYAEGLANYAGLNFRAPASGRSVIADVDTGSYPLTSRSKYYVRFGGVSGIHESATFPTNLTLYGYAFTFQSYRLSFLDSDNEESRTDGVVTLPVPSGFPVEFERMKFLCRGNLDSARLPANIDTKHLVYWNTDLKLLSLQFKPESGDPCSLTKRYLVLGVETKLPFIPQALHTALAIKNNGNLATAATDVEGVDSRFPVPANLQLQGPGGSFYPLTTAGDGYFNNWERSDKPTTGFYNIAARVRVPFFRDVKIHLHVTPTGTNSAQLALMGGWAAEEGKGTHRGWNVGAQNYFNTAKFDRTHDGWPAGVSLTDYRKNAADYRPRAQQNWIDVADFDYPLAWNETLRQFKGFADATVILPVIDVNSRLKELTPGKVDFDFAQDLNLQLPRLKVLDFANDALNEINAPLDSLAGALRSQLGAGLDVSGLTSGFRSLQNVLRENPEGFFRPVLEPALDAAVVNNLYNALAAELAANGKAALLAKTAAIVGANSNLLQSAIMNLNGTAGQATKVFGQLDHTFADAEATLNLFLDMIKKDGGGNRNVMRAVIKQFGADIGDIPDSLLASLLQDLEPTLASIESDLRQLLVQFAELRAQITGASGDFAAALNAANHSGGVGTYVQQAGGGMVKLLDSVVGPANDYFTADPLRARREIRERLIATFLGSPVPGSYQTAFRQFMSDKNFQLDQLMDVLFDQVNRSIRDGLSSYLAGAQDGIPQPTKGGGGGSLLSAKIRGSPTFEGDSLRRIHLDAEIKMKLPDDMTFSAYMDIKELDSQSTALSCIPAGGPAAEVTLGAKDIPLDWLGVSSGGPLKLNIEARWTLQEGAVLGIGGSFEVLGKIGFKGGSINDFGASLAIGKFENYIAAKAGATVTIIAIPVDFNVGIFAGRACSLDPLKFIDPEVEEVLITKADEFAGIYLQFGASVSLSDILFGSSSCLLDLTGSVNYALFYQGGPRFGSIGGRQKLSLSADLICIISAEASWAMGYRLDTEGKLSMAGKARLCGKIGACPFCLKACATLSVSGTVTDEGVDYSIDY
ncbi:MAG: LamG domain-containing protein [Verrucomicrobia bacterium]|nr:LamG domain-containing protein [Verrucomicrobiota bacterium]